MRILAISDEPSPRLWGEQCRQALSGIDLILSAGDLPASYLSYLTCFSSAPVVYVHGNHDDSYARTPPEGCLCADGKVVLVNGVRILGLGGSIRYRPDAVNMYTEEEMAARIASLRGYLKRIRGFDILLTHSPLRGVGDQDNRTHRGFECFAPLLETWHPAVMVFGHVHQSYSSTFVRRLEYAGVPLINASVSWAFDLPPLQPHPEPTWLGRRRLLRDSEL